ncbi:hypothetical protein CYMTET_15418, partial [Cymbomonas tetramitiformis]
MPSTLEQDPSSAANQDGPHGTDTQDPCSATPQDAQHGTDTQDPSSAAPHDAPHSAYTQAVVRMYPRVRPSGITSLHWASEEYDKSIELVFSLQEFLELVRNIANVWPDWLPDPLDLADDPTIIRCYGKSWELWPEVGKNLNRIADLVVKEVQRHENFTTTEPTQPLMTPRQDPSSAAPQDAQHGTDTHVDAPTQVPCTSSLERKERPSKKNGKYYEYTIEEIKELESLGQLFSRWQWSERWDVIINSARKAQKVKDPSSAAPQDNPHGANAQDPSSAAPQDAQHGADTQNPSSAAPQDAQHGADTQDPSSAAPQDAQRGTDTQDPSSAAPQDAQHGTDAQDPSSATPQDAQLALDNM